MSHPLERLGPVVWSYLTAHALHEAQAAAAPRDDLPQSAFSPWSGTAPFRQRYTELTDWEYLARFVARPQAQHPYSLGIGLAGAEPVGFVELYEPTSAACQAGLRQLQEAGADGVVAVCQPTPGAALHVRSLLASRWWELAAAEQGLGFRHAYFSPETDRPLPFAWPEPPSLSAVPRQPLTMLCNPNLTPEQEAAALRLRYNPRAPLRYVALLEDWPVGVASVSHGPLGSYGEDGGARWSVGAEDGVCLIKWASSLLVGWGIGTLAYAKIEADAVAAGMAAVVLEAAPFTTTDRFWHGLGFQMVERDMRTPYRYMEKRLFPMDRPAPISA